MPSQEKGFLLKAVIIVCIALIGSLLALEGGLRLLADTGKFDRQLSILAKSAHRWIPKPAAACTTRTTTVPMR